MGWFWQSPSTSPKPERSSSAPATPPAASQPPAPPQVPPQTTTAAETEDREVALFLSMFFKDAKPDQDSSSPTASSNNTSSASPTASTSAPTPPPSSSSPAATTSTTTSWFSWARAKSRQPEPAQPQPQPQPHSQPAARARTPQSLAMSEHLLPTTMSCRDAFDYAWHCHTPGSQWNAVYRYGAARTCSELWDDFWFCMRTRSYAPDLRAEAIREHYRAKEEAKYGGGRPSSEDVWESRDERVAPGTAFRAKFDPPVRDDAEFQRLDAERRRKIREMRGMEQKKE